MDDLRNKKILVTGGNGYLGSFLVNSLKELGADVYIIDQKEIGTKNEFCINITNRTAVEEVIKEIQPQIIFHLAALLNRDRDFFNHEKIMQVNYFGTVNLLMALKDIEYDNFIFTSTSEIYGSNKAPFKENMLPLPASPYSMSKVFAETALKTFSTTYNKRFTILRLFNFFGRNMPNDFFIPQLLNALKNDECFKMTKGEQERDFLYIDDVVQAMMLAANNERAKNEIFNVCSGQSTTLKDFATDCKKIMNSNCRIDFGALKYRENEVWNMVGDNSKIKKELGFKIKFDVKDIIQEIIITAKSNK
jgi:UDP-glucose 4-epimerase